MDTSNNVVDKICKWCGRERFELPSKILVCLTSCDVARISGKDKTIIPILEQQ